MADQALKVQHESGAAGQAGKKAENTVLPGDFFLRIAQQRETEAKLLSKAQVRRRLVDANPQYLSSRSIEISKTTLVCLELLRSTRRVGEDVEGQHHALLAPEITEPNEPAGMVRQLKIRRLVSDVKGHPS
jgi:hypothetical protein